MKIRNHLLLLAALALAAAPATAAPITVDESSFEGAKAIGGWTGAGAVAGESTASVPGPWVKTGGGFGSGWTIASQYSGGIPDGDIYAYANGGTDIRQTFAATLQANTTYTLTVAVGWRADLPGLGFPTYPGYGIELWAGGTLLASDYDTGHGGTGVATPAGDEWKDAVITYTSPSSVTADPLEIRLIGYGIQTNYDHVRLDGTLVGDTTAPTIVPPTNPADEAGGVLVSSELVATFDENVALTGAGTVTIRDLGAGPDVVITLPGPDSDGTVSVSGTELTINPAAALATTNNYAVQISADAVQDLAAPANAFAGILDDTTWNFQTAADGTAPTIVFPTSPADGASGVSVDTNLVATFDETIAPASGNITIKNITEGSDTVIPVGDARVSVSGTDLTIDPATDLDPGDDYAIRIDAGAVTDTTGNPFAGIGDDTTWNFTTSADTVNPTLVFPTSPADDAIDVTVGSLVATFSEPILATAPTILHNWDFESGNGGFTLKAAGGGYTPDGSAWEHGDPDSTSPGGSVTGGNPGSENGCWGTNLGLADDGHYIVST